MHEIINQALKKAPKRDHRFQKGGRGAEGVPEAKLESAYSFMLKHSKITVCKADTYSSNKLT